MRRRTAVLSVAMVLSSVGAFAQGTEGPGTAAEEVAPELKSAEAIAAKDLVGKYLTAVKAKKWAEAKRFLHPKTLTAIAERKKRLGKEDHPMAPWYHEKVDAWLKDFTVVSASKGATGTFIVEASEDNFQIEEKRLAEKERASYLVGKKDGTWYVVDKKRGESFTSDSIKLGYKGWFDAVPAPAPAAE